MGELVWSHPHYARQIVDFASANLVLRRDRPADDCACPTDLAVATIRVVPELADPLRRILEDRYPECDSAVEAAMEQSLSGIAPGAGGRDGSSGPTLPGSRPNDETCGDASAPGCGFFENPETGGAVASQANSPTDGSLAGDSDPATELSPELRAEILEALEANPERENQCIATNAFSALVAANPDLAMAIMEFAELKLPSKGRILGDECVCPIELATATVRAIPELTVPIRRALEDRYPECTEPGAGGRGRIIREFPPANDNEESCRDTSSVSCGFVPGPPASPTSF
jgi:hypothetical protein